MKNLVRSLAAILPALCVISSCTGLESGKKEPVDYVNPYMGNISHLLVPTYPTVSLPNSMMRIYPNRADFTSEQIKGLPLVVTDCDFFIDNLRNLGNLAGINSRAVNGQRLY